MIFFLLPLLAYGYLHDRHSEMEIYWFSPDDYLDCIDNVDRQPKVQTKFEIMDSKWSTFTRQTKDRLWTLKYRQSTPNDRCTDLKGMKRHASGSDFVVSLNQQEQLMCLQPEELDMIHEAMETAWDGESSLLGMGVLFEERAIHILDKMKLEAMDGSHIRYNNHVYEFPSMTGYYQLYQSKTVFEMALKQGQHYVVVERKTKGGPLSFKLHANDITMFTSTGSRFRNHMIRRMHLAAVKTRILSIFMK